MPCILGDYASDSKTGGYFEKLLYISILSFIVGPWFNKQIALRGYFLLDQSNNFNPYTCIHFKGVLLDQLKCEIHAGTPQALFGGHK